MATRAVLGKRHGRSRRCHVKSERRRKNACTKCAHSHSARSPLHIAIVGYGTFGQFLASRLVQQGHHVSAWSRSDRSEQAHARSVRWCRNLATLCDGQPDLVILSTSITSTESVLRSLPMERLHAGTAFIDVLSVKEFPKRLFQNFLPDSFDFVCTHPMFGPDSGAGTWENLPLVYDMARVREQYGLERCKRLLQTFEDEGCRMVPMDCAEHDRQAASSQFITHTVGRMLMNLDLPNTDINTKGYESLLNLVRNTANDSFELYYGLFLYNQNATEELDKLESAFQQVTARLREKLIEDASSGSLPKLAPPPEAATEEVTASSFNSNGR